MQHFGIDFNGDGITSAGERFLALVGEGENVSRQQDRESRRRRDAEIGRSVGCFMALVVGVTFFILSYL